jgi:predicted flap endonuclease-1-like 5' DNA nuclease
MDMDMTAPLILIALLAIVAIVAIAWGTKLRRERSAGARTFTANREAAERGSPGSTTAPPVAPSPPPLANEPIVAAAAFDASPASIAADVPVAPPAPAPTESLASNLTQLKGLGPKLAATLAELGVTRIDQIAALSPADAAALDARLGAFQGRMARDRWIEQARLLNAGDKAGYEAEFGKLGG